MLLDGAGAWFGQQQAQQLIAELLAKDYSLWDRAMKCKLPTTGYGQPEGRQYQAEESKKVMPLALINSLILNEPIEMEESEGVEPSMRF